MNAKDFLKEICYGDRHREFSSIIISMQKEEPNDQTNRLLELFCVLSEDLFKLDKILN